MSERKKIAKSHRLCKICKQELPIESFYRQNGYRMNTCKKCYCSKLKISGNWTKIIKDMNIK
jgi:flavoprotein